MRRPSAPRRLAALLGAPLTLLLLAAWFILLRPVTLGGPAGYVIVSGHSMEPAFLTGDLAITQRRDTYRIGDVVAFATDGGVVIHRIVGGDAEHGFTTQGDNKDLPDLWHPRPDNIVGTVWLHVPGVGTALAYVRQPAIIAALSASVAFLLAFGVRTPRPASPDQRGRRWRLAMPARAHGRSAG